MKCLVHNNVDYFFGIDEQNKINRVNDCLWRTHNISITECIVDMGLSQSIFERKHKSYCVFFSNIMMLEDRGVFIVFCMKHIIIWQEGEHKLICNTIILSW